MDGWEGGWNLGLPYLHEYCEYGRWRFMNQVMVEEV